MRKISIPAFILLALLQHACTNKEMPNIITADNSLDGKVSACKDVTYQNPYASYLISTRTSKTVPYSYEYPSDRGAREAAAATCSTISPHFISGDGSDLVITGTATFEDKTYDKAGFTGTEVKPIRYAVIEALVDGISTATATTLGDGTYTLTISSYTTGTVTVRVQTKLGGGYSGSVVDDSSSANPAAIYTVTRSDITGITGAGTLSADICTSIANAGPAFNIMDNIVDAQYTAQALSTTGKATEEITAHWYDGSADGTYYMLNTDSQTHDIYILGKSTDTDQYDDSVILHEMGHYIAEVYSKDDSDGGAHQFDGHYDLRLTWSEGWATFFQSLVKDMVLQDLPEYYIDTANTMMYIEIETPSHSELATGPDNELAVATMLWDIYDTETTGTDLNDEDPLSDGAANLWSVFEIALPEAAMVSFEDFYDGWVAGAGRTHEQLKPILEDRSVNYEADTYESNDTVATAGAIVPCTEQTHTYFPKGDVDYFKVDVSSGLTYIFFTKDLKDGADTLLTLYDSDGTTQLAQNDDETDRVNLSDPPPPSAIAWKADGTKTVYIASEPYKPIAEGDPVALGDYGTYTLAIDIFQ